MPAWILCNAPEIAASAEDDPIASRIDAAKSVLIMCGNGCHGAAAELQALSDRLKAPLIHSVKGQDIMPYDDPHWMGGIGFIGSKPVYNAVMSADLLLMVGTDYPYSDFLPNRPVVYRSTSGRRCSAAARQPRSAWLARAADAQTADRTGRAENQHKLLGPAHGGAPRLGPQARPAG